MHMGHWLAEEVSISVKATALTVTKAFFVQFAPMITTLTPKSPDALYVLTCQALDNC